MKKFKYWGIIFVLFLLILILCFLGYKGFKYSKESIIKNAIIKVELREDRNVDFDSKVKISDFIVSINGELIDDKEIDTSKLGEKNVNFKYINEEGIKVPYEFKINIVDRVAPIIWLGSTYSVTTSYSSTLEHDIMCVDNYDDEPYCHVEGDYDTTTPGNYNLVYVAEDKSGNRSEVEFTLNVSYPNPDDGNTNYETEKYNFNDAKRDFAGEGIKLGIDVSAWQGDIDFDKVKNAGVQFAFVRVGSRVWETKEFFQDSKFEEYMEGFNRVGIPVGAYFYSYAFNEKEAKEDALWVISKLKKYNVQLPVAFDFEDWADYNEYKMSLYRLNRNVTVFIETLESAGYEGILYGSASYMDKIFNTAGKEIWVAHWNRNVSYKDVYKYWQFSSIGEVDGINGNVDLNIMYE